MSKALVVLSGGQDSTTCLFEAVKEHDEVYALTFNYGQRHKIELEAAQKVARLAGVKNHEIHKVGENTLTSTSPLTSESDLEQYDSYEEMDKIIGNRVEKTFVPMRNTLFLTIAFNRAVAWGCNVIYTGVCQEDNANYPDCTSQFIDVFEDMANVSLGFSPRDGRWISIVTPLMHLSKAETVKKASTNINCWRALAHSHTSYDGKYPPTDNNHANVLRAQGFKEAGMPDPLVLRAYSENLMELPETDNYRWYVNSPDKESDKIAIKEFFNVV